MRKWVVPLVLVLAARPAGQGHAAAEGWFDVPVPGGARTLAALGIAPDERAFTFTLLARALQPHESRAPEISQRLSRMALPTLAANGDGPEPAPADVPLPLTHDAWGALLNLKPGEDLFSRIAGDRAALLIAYGLTATDPSIRTMLQRDRELLAFLYREAPGAFALAARSLSLQGDRVVSSGGAYGDRVWESLAGASPADAPRFIRALLLKDEGRLAWYFDTIAQLDGDRLAAVWPDASAMAVVTHAHDWYEVFRQADPQWRAALQPFRRTVADPWSVIWLTDTTGGRVAGPAWTWLWEALFNSTEAIHPHLAGVPRNNTTPVSMVWLAREISSVSGRERRDRFEMFRLAQRVFANAPESDAGHVAATLSGFRRYRAVLLALERMGVTTPQVWAAAVEAARFIDREAEGNRADNVAIFQGVFAIIDRARRAGSIHVSTAERLITSLNAAVRQEPPVSRALAAWIVSALIPGLPALERPDAWTRRTAYESTILQALVGPRPATPRRVEWEGLSYEIDYSAAERERLTRVRKLLPSPGLDAALASGRARDLATALIVLAYASALGDADGAAALSRDAAERHDFNLSSTSILRDTWPWAPAEERHGDGAPWRMLGSIIGLDLGLSRLALRRVADDHMPAEPTLSLNDFAILSRTAVSASPSAFRDEDRDDIAAAIARGRQRAQAAGRDLRALTALSIEAGQPSFVRSLLPWMLARQPAAVASLFSTRDLLWLGKPAVPADRLDRWGVHGAGLDGRQTSAMPRPASWENFAGRSDLGQMATQVPDVILRLAEETARLKLPAALVPALLAFAIQDYWHDVQARFTDDWMQMVRQAAALSPSRVEDYVAALAGDGPLRRPQ